MKKKLLPRVAKKSSEERDYGMTRCPTVVYYRGMQRNVDL
jgi:hypothetical protein